jgi:hypothetical protein
VIFGVCKLQRGFNLMLLNALFGSEKKVKGIKHVWISLFERIY